MGRTGGSGISSTYGAPRGDFSPYKSQEKGKETPAQLKNQDARKALYQFARGSQAAAGLRDGKGANAKRAMMGGNIQGSEAFTDNGVELDKLGGLTLDTNAPVSSSDLSNLAKDVAEGAKQAEKKQEKEEKDFWTKLGQSLLEGLADVAIQGVGKMVNNGIDELTARWAGNREGRVYASQLINMNASECINNPSCVSLAHHFLTDDEYVQWGEGGKSLKDFGVGRWGAGRYLYQSGDANYYEHWNSGYGNATEHQFYSGGTTNCTGSWVIENGKPVCKK